MTNTFEMADFDAAIKAKDYIQLKNFIINSIRNNPGFRYTRSERTCSEASEAFNKLKEMKSDLPGLFSPYALQTGEKEFNEDDKDSWNQEYFIRQTFLLGENFCVKRFQNVRKIGQYLYKQNFDDPQEVLEGYESASVSVAEPTRITGSEYESKKPWPEIIACIIAIVLLLVGIVADKKWLLAIGIVAIVAIIVIAIFRRRK